MFSLIEVAEGDCLMVQLGFTLALGLMGDLEHGSALV
jgi:hypothetical protein